MIVEKVIKVIVFCLMINWCISAQIYQQTVETIGRKEKFTAVLIALLSASLAATALVI